MEGDSSDSTCSVSQNVNQVYYNDPETYLEQNLQNLQLNLLDMLEEDSLCHCDGCWKPSSLPKQTSPVSLTISHSTYSVVTNNTEKTEVQDEPTPKIDVPASSYPNVGHWALESSIVNRSYSIEDRLVGNDVPNKIDRSWVDIENIWKGDVVGDNGWGDKIQSDDIGERKRVF